MNITIHTVGIRDKLAQQLAGQLTAYTKVAEKTIYTVTATRGIHIAVSSIATAQPRPPVDRGGYRQSFRVDPIPGGAVLYNVQPYAGVLELGRRPNRKRPPIDVIARWVLRKGLVSRAGNLKPNQTEWQAARAIAFAIANKMGKEGWPFPPNKPMRIMDGTARQLISLLPAEIARAWAAYKQQGGV